jgi:diphosphomevalonate decarboxylase
MHGVEGVDRIWLNGKEEDIKRGGRTWVCLKELREERRKMEEKDEQREVGF